MITIKRTLSNSLLALTIVISSTGCATTPANQVTANQATTTSVPPVSAVLPSSTPVVKDAPKPSANSATQRGKQFDAKIVKVVDGDTMDISYKDGDMTKQETVRLLLVDTPETVHPDKPVEPFGPEASNFAKDTLSNQNVKIEIDVSERDKYGRLLCYLYIGDKMFNEMLIEKGLARVAYVYPPNIKYVDQFREIQKKAQQTGLGIWSIENYAQEDGFHDEAVKASPTQTTKPTSKPAKVESNTATNNSNVIYSNCTEAKAAGAYNIKRGEPGYSSKLDRDNDGVACEK